MPYATAVGISGSSGRSLQPAASPCTRDSRAFQASGPTHPSLITTRGQRRLAALARNQGVPVTRTSVLLEHPLVRVGGRSRQRPSRLAPDFDIAAELGLVGPPYPVDGKVPVRVGKARAVVHFSSGRARVHHVSGPRLAGMHRDHAVRFTSYHMSQHGPDSAPRDYVFYRGTAHSVAYEEVAFLKPIKRNERGARCLYS